MSSCFEWKAIFAFKISGRSCKVLSMRCSVPLKTTVKSGSRAFGETTEEAEIVQYCHSR